MTVSTAISFGPVPVDVACWFAGYPLDDPALARKWATLDRSKVGLARTSSLYIHFYVEARFGSRAIVSGRLDSPGRGSNRTIGNWRPFAALLRGQGVAYDFVRAENHGVGSAYWDDEETGSMVLERWRPGMKTPHQVLLDPRGKPTFSSAQLRAVGRAANPKGKIRAMLGTDLGRLEVRTRTIGPKLGVPKAGPGL